MLASLESLGLGVSDNSAPKLCRNEATLATLTSCYERASERLSPKHVAHLPEEKRAVALALAHVLAAAYEAECIVLEACNLRARQELDDGRDDGSDLSL